MVTNTSATRSRSIPAPRRNTPGAIHDAFAKARAQGKIRGQINASELCQIVGVAVKDGFTRAEKQAFVHEWSGTFGQTSASPVAREIYRHIASAFDLPRPQPFAGSAKR